MNKTIIRISLIALVSIFAFTQKAVFVNADILDKPESVIFENIGHETGLSNLSVSSIIQDINGFMWFGTQGGLNMYNSNDIKVYSHNPFSKDGLPNNLIQTMFYDETEHVIWIGTYQGLSRFDINTETFKNYSTDEHGISNEIIVSITKDQLGNIWFGTLDGLNKLDVTTDTVSTYEVPGDVIRDLVFDSNGNLLIGTYEGLCKFNFQTELVEKIDIALPSDFVMVMGEYNTGTLTIGMWAGGVVEVSLDTFEVTDTIIETENVYSMMFSSDELLYIGTWGNGLFVAESSENIHHFESLGGETDLAHSIVYSLTEDKTGLVWIGTNGGGISLLNKEKSNKVIHRFDEDNANSINPGKINEIFVDDGLFYYAIYNEGLNVYDPLLDEMRFYEHIDGDETSIKNNNINAIMKYNDTLLYLGTNSGIEIYDITTNTFSRSNIVPDNHIVYSLVLKDDVLWIGTYQNGVYIYDINSETLTNVSDLLPAGVEIDKLINEIFIDSKERVWIGTNDGLNLLKINNGTYQMKTFYNEGYDFDQLGSDIIKTITEDDNNVIWVGTNGGGISRYNEDETFTTYTSFEGLSGNIVNGIKEDNNGFLWVATQKGISKFDDENEIFIQYNLDDGIGDYTFTSNVLYYENTLYFGGNHGVVAINEDYSSTGKVIPNAFITDITVLQKSISDDMQVFNDYDFDLPFKENSVGFQIDSLNYQKSKSVLMKYRLIGFDDEYITFEDFTYVHYSNLPPGDYTFSVVSSMLNSDQSEEVVVHFTIANPWYRTGVAFVSYVLIVIGAGYLGLMIWESRVFKGKNEELQLLNSKLQLLSIEDPLTKAFNRRYFETQFNDLLGIAKRSKITFTIMLFDIDDFKLVNDLNGHLAGDEVLKSLVKKVNLALKRSSDFIARIGGDEFIILMFDTNVAGSKILANKLKTAIEGPTLNQKITITISAGVVTIKPDENTELEDIFDIADKQLYKAKNAGKNQISFYDSKDVE